MQWLRKWYKKLAWITSSSTYAKTRGGQRRRERREKNLFALLICGGIAILAASLTFLDLNTLFFPAAYVLTACIAFASARLLGGRALLVSGGCCLFLLLLGSWLSPHSASGYRSFPVNLFAVCSMHFVWMLGVMYVIVWSEAVRRNGALTAAKAARAAMHRARAVRARQEAVAQLQAQTEQAAFQSSNMMAMNSKLQHAQTELEAQYLSLEAANARYARLATTDGMTGLANHRAFQEQLTRQMARANRTNAPLSLLLLDVDKFKQYNDTFGHPAGDDVLKLVGQILLGVVRDGDFAARYGGEEFAVILPDSPSHIAALVAERVRAAVERANFPNRAMTISVGVAQNRPGESNPTLIQRADVALYEAKSAGRNCVVVFQAAMMESSEEEEEGAAGVVPGDLAQHANDENNLWMVEADTAWQASERGGRRRRDDKLRSHEEIAFTAAALLASGGLEGILQEPPALLLSELLSAMDRRHAQPIGHTERVSRYALRLARELAIQYDEQRETRPLLPRITQGDIADIAFGALVHDIGKSGIPDAILRKSGKLTEDEWRQIRRHPLVGAELISACPLLSRALPIVRFHHERWDGTGYPQGLAGEAIPLGARIFALCDTLETLLSEKPYRPRMEFAAARQEIVRASGTQFDPDIVHAFLQIPEEDWMDIDGCHHLLHAETSAKAA